MQYISLDTHAQEEMIEITGIVHENMLRYRWDLTKGDALLQLWCFHTTAGLTINENADPDVRRDMLLAMAAIVPDKLAYRHAEGNSTAHIKASLFGSQLCLSVVDGEVQLGRWQGIYFCEFDGPRRDRRIGMQLIGRPN